MPSERIYTVTTVPDKDCDKFTMSTCPCAECLSTHLSVAEWSTFKPKSALQKGMLRVIAKLEADVGGRRIKRRKI